MFNFAPATEMTEAMHSAMLMRHVMHMRMCR